MSSNRESVFTFEELKHLIDVDAATLPSMSARLSCPFCKALFPTGAEWREHFLSCPRREGPESHGPAHPRSASEDLLSQVRAIEVRMSQDQQTIERLKDRIKALEKENADLRNAAERARRALEM